MTKPESEDMMAKPFGTPHSLFDELVRIHRIIRRELDTCQRVAEAVAMGETVSNEQEQLQELRAHGIVQQLRTDCLCYCRFVHAHHRHEDAWMLPTLRRESSELDTAIDRLQADHRRVSSLLDRVEGEASELSNDNRAATGQRLAQALTALSEELLEHLNYEEDTLEPVLSEWRALA